MRKIRLYTIFVLLTICCLNSCKGQNSSIYSDTTIYKTDTVFNNVLIDGKVFTIKILHDKLEEHLKPFDSVWKGECASAPLTILISNDANQNVYAKKFEHKPNDYPNINYSLYKGLGQKLGDTGKLYFMMNEGYCGSGSGSIRYNISFSENEINLNELFASSGELAHILYNKNDNDILLLEGIWGLKWGATDPNESHFANHRYMVSKYEYNSKYHRFYKKELGQTKLKYSSLDEGKTARQVLTDIHNNEPMLLGAIHIFDYH